MSKQQTTKQLQSMLTEAIRAYEQTQANRLQAQQRGEAERRRTVDGLAQEKEATQTQLEEAHRRQMGMAQAEQGRVGGLVAENEAVEAAAKRLLNQAGLAHIVGSPLAVDVPAAPVRRGDAEVMTAFVEAQTAFVDLRRSICELAQAQLEAEEWGAVRQTVKPLLLDQEGALYEVAFGCLRESYYRQGKAALDDKNGILACKQFEKLLIQDEGYRNTVSLLDQAKVASLLQAIEFVQVPAGQFIYGDQKQQVHLDAFQISKTPITNAQYQIFINATDYPPPSHWDYGQIPRGKEDHPVVHVSWNGAQSFCRWAGLRLPMEREWEKAARGVDGRTYPWGEQAPTGQLCNFNNQVGDTTSVGQFPQGASPYGCLDMAGNVWEWCEDTHERGGRVLRGGAFFYREDYMRCNYRYNCAPLYQYPNLGFRCVVVAPSF